MSQGIILLGMHRSGTSAVSAVFSKLGFGVPGQAVPPNASNPKGHWEPRGVVETHDQFLHAMGRTWGDPRPWRTADFEGQPAIEARKALAEFVGQSVTTASKWSIKDPRMCRLLPLWEELRNGDLEGSRYVHVLRSPLAVAESLRARDAFGLERSLLLWLRHNLEAELGTRGEAREWIAFEELSGSGGPPLARRIRRATGKSRLTNKAIEAALGEVMDAGLVHHTFGQDESLQQLAEFPWVETALRGFAWLLEGREEEAVPLLDAVRREMHGGRGLVLGDVEAWEAESNAQRFFWLHQEIENYQRSIAVQRDEIAAQRAEIDVLRQSFTGERDAHAEVMRKVELVLASLDSDEARGASEPSLTALTGIEGSLQQLAGIVDSLSHLVQQEMALGEGLQSSLAGLASLPDQVGSLGDALAKETERRRGLQATLAQLEVLPERVGDLGETLAGILGHEPQGWPQRLLDASRRLERIEQGLQEAQRGAEARQELLASIEQAGHEALAQLSDPVDQRHLSLLDKALEVTARIEEQWAEARSAAESLESELEAESNRAAGLAADLAATQEAADGLRRRIAIAIRERALAFEDRDRSRAELEAAARESERLGEALADIEGELSRLEDRHQEVEAARQATQFELDQVTGRFSWKVTGPLRWLRGKLKGIEP